MIPNIPENIRNRKKTKRGKKRMLSKAIFQERFQTIERLFAWEDKFKRLLLRFERKSENHFGMKLIAYAMINLRHFCPAENTSTNKFRLQSCAENSLFSFFRNY